MITATLTRTLRINGETVGAANQQLTAGLLTAIDETIPASSVDYAVNMRLGYAGVTALLMVATADMTVKTNDATAPDNTFTLKANVPYVWTSEDGYDLRDTVGPHVLTSISNLYVTSTAEGTLKIRALSDPTA